MTPGARVAAAIDVLGEMSEGTAAEQALTRWARKSRFAGSKDRAAVRDLVFDVLRNRRRAAHFGQGDAPRQLMIGLLHLQGADLGAFFDGVGHAPPPLTGAEGKFPAAPTDTATAWDLPDWLVPAFFDSLGDGAADAAAALQARAPVFVRVNTGKTTVSAATERLANDGIVTRPNPLCETALTVTEGARKLRNSAAYAEGLIELQDAASQAVVAALPATRRVLDFCAGGGGKALALAANPALSVHAHDIDPKRMSDLPVRAARAGASVSLLATDQLSGAAPFDLVLCDAPCSGSGAWRRSPEGKWRLSPEGLTDLNRTQDAILGTASELVAQHGTLAYATCSVLRCENEDRVAAFLERHPGWQCLYQKRYAIGADGDGFFAAHLKRE